MPTVINRTYRQKRDHKELGYKKSKDWQIFYGSRAWKTLRHWKLNHDPLCQNCLLYGISTPAEHVHHVIPFRLGKTKEEKWDLFLDPENIRALCPGCHRLIHNQMNKTQDIINNVIPEKLNI